MLKSGALNVAKDLLRGGPRFAATCAFSRRVPLANGLVVDIRRKTSDLEVVRQIWRDEQYAIPYAAHTNRLKRYEAAIRADGHVPVIVDAGANIGAAALWFANVWPSAHVVAVEPDAGNAAMARRNCAAFPSIQIVEAAIGSAPGFVATDDESDAYAVTTHRAAAGVPIVQIDECVSRVHKGALFAVKLDIEGFEDDLFAANIDWLDEARLVYIEPHDHLFPERRSSTNFQAEMGRRNFDVLIRGENLVYIRREEQTT